MSKTPFMSKTHVLRKTHVALFGAVATGVLALGISSVLAFPAQARPEKVIDLAVGNDGVVHTDVGTPGLSVGDEFVYADKLFRDGKQVGEDGSSCQVAKLDGSKIVTNCVLSVQLPDGQLTAQSLWIKGTDTVRMAITGGTGAYRGATGELTCNDIQTPHETYRISLDR
ncbi:allene oxide cyclase barrel-like domain-containing protein [Streptomyces sp. HMX87]|uniref:allene oxide cyclase barrel-like domain-containing protein n=1 Tax=Streptomyces sp. HMX87 TaxID=3390849 RepID=UPI003A8762DD